LLKINLYNQIHSLSIRMTSKSFKSLIHQSLTACFRKESEYRKGKKYPLFTAGQGPVALQFTVIMRYSIVAKITLNANANTHVNGSFFFYRFYTNCKLLFCHFTSFFVKYFASMKILRLGKLHVVEYIAKNIRSSSSVKGFFNDSTRYFS